MALLVHGFIQTSLVYFMRKLYDNQRNNRQKQIQFSHRYKLVKMNNFFYYIKILTNSFSSFANQFSDLTNPRYFKKKKKKKKFLVPLEFVKTKVHCRSFQELGTFSVRYLCHFFSNKVAGIQLIYMLQKYYHQKADTGIEIPMSRFS